jgi:hypothetical protein
LRLHSLSTAGKMVASTLSCMQIEDSLRDFHQVALIIAQGTTASLSFVGCLSNCLQVPPRKCKINQAMEFAITGRASA